MTDGKKAWLVALEEKLAGMGGRFPPRPGGRGASSAELETFETTHGVALPADYREMLETLGNGPPGLLPLHRWDDALQDRAPLSAPSLLSPGKAFDDYGDDEPAQGTIALTSGNPRAVLVVSGEHRGQVFYVDLDDYEVDLVEHASGRSATVGEWYGAWLDATAPGASPWSDRRVLGEGLLGDTSTLAAVLADPLTPPSRRAKALVSLTERPTLDAATVAEVRRSFASEDATVRAEALACTARHDAEFFVATLPRILGSDTDTKVRKRASDLIDRLPTAMQREALEIVLDDASDALVFSALRRLIASWPSELAQYALRAGVRRGADARRLLLQAMTKAGDASCVPALVDALDDLRAPVRVDAARALYDVDRARWFSELARRSETDPDPSVRKRFEDQIAKARQELHEPET